MEPKDKFLCELAKLLIVAQVYLATNIIDWGLEWIDVLQELLF